MLVSTDTELTRRAAAGDQDAFERVYAESFRVVWRFASRRVSERASAEALTDRILRAAFAELDGYDGQVPYAAWLFSLARRVASTRAPHPTRPPKTSQRDRQA